MNRAEQLVVLSGATADQWGLVTAAQAKQLGLNAVQLLRLAEVGLLESVGRGVYLLSAGGMPQHLEIKVAWLRLQPKQFAWERPAGHRDSGVVSHASACRLHELGDIPAPEVEISVPRRRTTTEPFVRLRTVPVEATQITVVDGLPVTTADRTIVDLLRAKADGGHVGGVIADAERRDLIAVDELAAHVQPFARKYGLHAQATGRELIDHLVAQAGESLRRHEVDRARREAFDMAAQSASLILEQAFGGIHKRIQEMQGLRSAGLDQAFQRLSESDPALMQAFANLHQPALGEVIGKLYQPNPALTRALQELYQPDLGVTRAIEQAMAVPRVAKERKSMELSSAHTQEPRAEDRDVTERQNPLCDDPASEEHPADEDGAEPADERPN
ncbi:type IV toxin-antitoxin system AbiEi family antitoxin domain-containing protein [Streptomyces incanus]|uniref:Type IV toxin-antitoxin system AbiEi family antitoxin domain-containing protein n=1 Tax=Streptomyces incanus TaxID=887453 RepID=A0ABW0XRX1_9ACTN